jgi:AICAR transformylase/IMP cyclohydrolase PurH
MAAVRRVDLASDEDSAALAARFSRAVASVRHCSPCSAATFAREMREQHGGLVTDRAVCCCRFSRWPAYREAHTC